MVFKQNEVKLGRDKSAEDPGRLGDDTKRVLGKIF
jgi:ESF2/ABP1 family protein